MIEGVLVEETHRQDNQYASLTSHLRINHVKAQRMASGSLAVAMQFPIKVATAPNFQSFLAAPLSLMTLI